MTELSLASIFPVATDAAWREAAAKALKGGDFDKKMINHSADGFAIQPLYPRKVAAELVRGVARRWQICQRVDNPDAETAGRQSLTDLEGGADALALVFAGAGAARGHGFAPMVLADMGAALEGVFLNLVSLRCEPAPMGRANAIMLAALVQRKGFAPKSCKIDFGLDPIGNMARTGIFAAKSPEIGSFLAETVSGLSALGFTGPFITCDARPVHEAGGSQGQELAYAMAASLAYLRILESGGMPLPEAMRALSFTLAVDADQFMGIAKLRALRKLMRRVSEACALEPFPITIHAETAWRMLTKRDAPVNMLRNTIAVFASGVGGADSITVLPHSSAQGLPNAFARRVARNSQHVLLEEAHLWRVADPAAGAGGIEALTDELCNVAWAQFQQIEREGGLISTLVTGKLLTRIATTRLAREEAISTRATPITGTSEFPNLAERAADIIEAPPLAIMHPLKARTPLAEELGFDVLFKAFSTGQSQTSLSATPETAQHVQKLPSKRDAEPFEVLRDRADATLAATGQRPRIFMANLGAIGAFNARTTFARALFEAGGVETISNDGFAQDDETDLVALADAFKASGAALACICSSDIVYAQDAADAAMALAASGAKAIYIAGRLPEMTVALTQAGVTAAIFVGCDVLKILEGALDVSAS